MRLSDLLSGIRYELMSGRLDTEIRKVICDSREQVMGNIFVCIEGYHGDGHQYIEQAAVGGAQAIVIQNKDFVSSDILNQLTVVYVRDSKEALAVMAINFYGNPANKLITIGITGTKGKTSIAAIIGDILKTANRRAGIIGTLGVQLPDSIEPRSIANTTPSALEIQKYLYEMVQSGCEYAILEVSSQGLKDKRVFGMEFDYGIYTNISIDHIGTNEHKDFAEYLECKSRLFKQCKYGIINLDDDHFYDIIKEAACRIYTYGFSITADLMGKSTENYEFKTYGMEDNNFKINAIGDFAVYNSLAAILFARLQGIPMEFVKRALKTFVAKGRMELVNVSDAYMVIIDYAHNAKSLENVLKSVRKYGGKRVIAMFGCGGNRSKTRRYEMGEISGRLADITVITEDNSRWESPFDIIDDILTGIKKTDGKYIVIPNRREAMKYCLVNAMPGDIIMFLGKGHEDYQEIQGKRYSFDERIVIKEIMEEIQNDDADN